MNAPAEIHTYSTMEEWIAAIRQANADGVHWTVQHNSPPLSHWDGRIGYRDRYGAFHEVRK